jgi:Na+-translocating ferredoxin:NAD+ oxidoreductase RnfG subunit
MKRPILDEVVAITLGIVMIICCNVCSAVNIITKVTIKGKRQRKRRSL